MKIGTPLSPSSTKVMLLGSGELGKEIIIALQRFGTEVIAVDRYPNAPGHQVAHRAHVIDMTDANALRNLIELEKPDIIVPEIEAIATNTLVEIELEELAIVIPSARAARLTMHREGIRNLAVLGLNLPASRYAFAETLTELVSAIDNTVGYPCILKPVMSSSGKGQFTIEEPADIEPAWNYATSTGRVKQNQLIVEQKVDFDYEITLLTVRTPHKNGKIATHFCQPIGHKQINGDYVESWQPQKMTDTALQRSKEIAKSITDNLGGQGLFGVELFVKGDQVWFSEVSPRPHDTGMVTMVTQHQNEFELHARAILGLPVSVDMISPGASAVIYGGVDSIGVVYSGLDDALNVPQTDLRLFGKPEAFERRRMGVTLAYADDTDTARERAKLAASKVHVEKGN